ncbi:MAG: tetratricopeptide repeat protein, partial [Pseudomonadales bacterium]
WTQSIHLYNTMGNYSAALELINKFGPNNPVLTLEKAKALNATRRYRDTLETLQNTAANFDEVQSSYYHLLMGQAQMRLGDMNTAKVNLELAATGAAQEDALVEIARMEALSGHSEAALAILRQILSRDPHHSNALILAGEISNFLRDYSAAEDSFSTALSYLPTTDIMLPERMKTLHRLSRVLTMLDRTNEAMIYKRILGGQSPDSVANRDRLQEIFILVEENQLDSAETELRSIIEERYNVQAAALLGIVSYLQIEKKYPKDVQADVLDPGTPEGQALDILVNAHLQLDEIDQVLAVLGPKIQSQDEHPSILGLYGLAKLAKRDQEGFKYLQRALALDPSLAHLRLPLLAYYQQKNRGEDALEQARLAHHHAANNPKMQGALLRQLINSGLGSEAQALALKLASSNPEDSSAQTLAGMVSIHNAQPDEAADYLFRALELDKQNTIARFEFAELALVNRDYDLAHDHFAVLMYLRPHNIGTFYGFLAAREGQGEIEQGLSVLESMTANVPNNGYPPAALANYYLEQGNIEQAQRYISLAIERQMGNAFIENVAVEITRHRTLQALSNNDTQAARSFLSVGLASVPHSITLLEMLAQIEINALQPEIALDIANTIKQLNPVSGLQLQGDILGPTDPALALEFYQQAWARSPNSELARRIYLLLSRQDPQEAKSFKRNWTAKLPKDPGLLLVKAREAQLAGKQDTAIKTYHQLLDSEPRNATALTQLAKLYDSKNDVRSLEFAEQAVDINPGNPDSLQIYGMALIKQGESEKGIAMLEKALKISPNSAEIQTQLDKASP